MSSCESNIALFTTNTSANLWKIFFF